MKKRFLVQLIKKLPEEFDLDKLLQKLIVIEKIEVGLEDVRNGRVVSHDTVKKEVKKWETNSQTQR